MTGAYDPDGDRPSCSQASGGCARRLGLRGRLGQVQIDRKLLIGLGATLGAIAVIALAVWLLRDEPDPLGERQRVRDAPSALIWEMRGEPEQTEETTDRTVEGGRQEVAVRSYTVDHGDWFERVQIYDGGASDVAFATAATSTFGGEGELEDLEFITVAGEYPGASGTAAGSVDVDGDAVPVTAHLFVTQIGGYVVSGGVAVAEGAQVEGLDPAAEAEALLATLEVP
jgi:hypothetical protein